MKPRFPLVTKILLVALLNVALLGIILAIFLQSQLHQEFESFLMTTGRERIFAVSRQIALELMEVEPTEYDAVLARSAEAHDVTFLLVGPGGKHLAGPVLEIPPEVIRRLQRGPSPGPFLEITNRRPRYWTGVRIPTRGESRRSPFRPTLLIVSANLWSNPFFFQYEPLLAILGVTVFVTLLCWLPLIRSLTHAIRQMMMATSSVANGQFDLRLDSQRQDELGSLGHSIDRMAARLEAYVAGQKRFLGDIAHELRSPLGRMQLALAIQERRTPEDQMETVNDLKDDVELLSGLTGELLEFAKAGLQRQDAALQATAVLPIAERAAAVEGAEEKIQIDIDSDLQVMANGELLFRALSNLVRNAVRYAGGSGPITISARPKDNHVEIVVSDSGPGVPEAELERIFDPFYRLDLSRDRRSGGTGLGLAIVRSSIEACGGTVSCRNRSPHGLEVIVTLARPSI